MRKTHLVALLSNIRIHYAGGGTKEDAVLSPEEKEKDYAGPDMSGRMPSYALFARHVIGLDVRAVNLPKVVKASY